MLRLKYHGTTTIPVEAECITPDNLTGKSNAEVAALLVQHGNRQAKLGDFFTVDGNADDRDILVEGDCSRVKMLGAEMATGRLRIDGNVGMHVGAEMRGGVLEVTGNAGDWVGAEMRGGRLHVHGDAGHCVGGAYRGGRYGMRGGAILIGGKAGNEIGCTMRRGLICIGGDAADFVGVGMIAGTVLVLGQPGIRAAAGMKRGSVVLLAPNVALLPTFRYDCTYQPLYLRLYFRQLRAWGMKLPAGCESGFFRRYSGDLVALGKGEVLHWTQC